MNFEDTSKAEPKEFESPLAGVNPDDPNYKKVEQNSKTYINILKRLIHSKETRDGVLEILKSSEDPYMTVPSAANQINNVAKTMMKQSGINVDINVQAASSMYLVGELIDLGNAAGIFKTTEEDIPELYQDALQMGIEQGLKDGSIDPIQLQLEAEQMLPQQAITGGQRLAEAKGIPVSPQNTQIMERYGDERARQAQVDLANKAKSNAARTPAPNQNQRG